MGANSRTGPILSGSSELIRLRDLNARFVKFRSPSAIGKVSDLADAQGVLFLCPKCFAANGGAAGTHSVICWFKDRGVPDDMSPKPGRWTPSGTGIDDLTFVGPGAASVQLTGPGCGWHGFVRNGSAE